MTPIVVSASGLASWLRCRKAFQIEYEWNREVRTTNDSVKLGSAFHKVMENMAKNGWQLKPRYDFPPDQAGMAYEMAFAYSQNREFPRAVVSAEKPKYTKLLDAEGDRPEMWLRTTMDLVYRRSAKTLVIRDYKTFSREPSEDVDLDLQARLYCVVEQLADPELNVEFEYDYVRSEIPGTRRLVKKEEYWNVNDCYRLFTVNVSPVEAQIILKEAKEAFLDIWEARKTLRYYRTGLKGSGMHTCNSCFVRDVCAKELEQGFLTAEDLDEYTTQREPLRMETP